MAVKPRFINVRGNLIDLTVPKVMGIINITPDSFFNGSTVDTEDEIAGVAGKMLEDGADILDIGGYSSRPGASFVSPEEERSRVLKAARTINREFPDAVISIDTFRSEIAMEAVLDYGAGLINDISAGEADKNMFHVVEKLNVPYILMHMQGEPSTMQVKPVYDDVVSDIIKWFSEKIMKLQTMGINDVIIDPGFGFGKTVSQNFKLLKHLGDFSITGLPLLAGLSRKAMIWKTLGISQDDALNGTSILNMVALLNGADIIRVHDVKEAVQTVKLFEELRK